MLSSLLPLAAQEGHHCKKMLWGVRTYGSFIEQGVVGGEGECASYIFQAMAELKSYNTTKGANCPFCVIAPIAAHYSSRPNEDGSKVACYH